MASLSVHEKFNSSKKVQLNNDVAIILLAEEVDLTKHTPVCLPSASDSSALEGKTAQVYGEIYLSTNKLKDDHLFDANDDNLIIETCCT